MAGTLTIFADGTINRGAARLPAWIHGTSPRELRADGVRVDVTHVWHSPDLAHIVDALLTDRELPSGYTLGARRRDNVVMVRCA